jgi:site-specific recombinase XerD
MKLIDLVTQYVSFRKSMGERCANEHILRSFCRTLGEKVDIRAVRAKSVERFLAGDGPLTRNWYAKYVALSSFYRYAVARGHVVSAPLPKAMPKLPPALVPYIYSPDELRRLLEAASCRQLPIHVIEPVTLRTIILLLYGAGLRVGEALALTIADVDLSEAVLTVRLSKFYKSRLVPLGTHLTQAMAAYSHWRQSAHCPVSNKSPFFVGRTGKPVVCVTLQATFGRLREYCGIHRTDGGRYQPRLHDLRHAFAVHRLIAWYRQGADVQYLLPHLSAYMGHVHLAATQVYLTMTPELLQEASARFGNYARREAVDE